MSHYSTWTWVLCEQDLIWAWTNRPWTDLSSMLVWARNWADMSFTMVWAHNWADLGCAVSWCWAGEWFSKTGFPRRGCAWVWTCWQTALCTILAVPEGDKWTLSALISDLSFLHGRLSKYSSIILILILFLLPGSLPWQVGSLSNWTLVDPWNTSPFHLKPDMLCQILQERQKMNSNEITQDDWSMGRQADSWECFWVFVITILIIITDSWERCLKSLLEAGCFSWPLRPDPPWLTV